MGDRVIFGEGALRELAPALAELGAHRVLLIGSGRRPALVDEVAALLGDRCVGRFAVDLPQVPLEVAEAARARARATNADWVVACGGGTPIGVAKAVALEVPVAVAAVPTTYAGSERTDIWGVTADGRKVTGRDPRVRPRLVVYDPRTTWTLPRELSLQSLLNALAHSVEALYAHDAEADALEAAEQSLRPLVDGLRAIGADPSNREGRERALRGAWLASTALSRASMGLHHKLAHVLGGSFGTAHGPTHALLLPYTFGFNAPAAPRAVDAARRAWGVDDPPGFLWDLEHDLGLPTALGALGLRHEQLPAVVDEILRSPYRNPRPYDREALLELLEGAWADRRPGPGAA